MSEFRTVTRDELLARVDDDFVRWVLTPDDVAVDFGTGYAVAYRRFEGDNVGGFVSGEPLAEGLDALTNAVRARGEELGWCSLPLTATPPPALASKDPGCWDFMTAYDVHDAKPARVDIIELDDVDCAQEITEFALAVNPRFEGNPGDGRSLFWRGIRGDDGALVATVCAKKLTTGTPHLAGLVVADSLRGTGAGRALLVEATRLSLELAGVCTLGVYHDNRHAIDLYRGVGYLDTHGFASYRLDGSSREAELTSD